MLMSIGLVIFNMADLSVEPNMNKTGKVNKSLLTVQCNTCVVSAVQLAVVSSSVAIWNSPILIVLVQNCAIRDNS